MSAREVDVVVFDILGTMVDEPDGIRRAVEALPAGLDDARTDELVAVWQAHVDDQQRQMLTGHRPYAATTAVDLEAAAHVAAAAGVTDGEAVRALAAAAQRPEPWSDTVAALDRISARFPVVGLSNADRSSLVRLNAHAGLRWHLVLSAEDVRSYKPRPEVYELAVAATGTSPDRLLMVAAHAWDLRGAQAIGMRTAYVERPVGDPPGPTDVFDVTATNLEELATILGCP
ncbi:haloacid dehalogenase type II [Georgenia sp. H159]|uniref:haloacid dehalogenase type II n=1 Tax=Georgenia sp. H159 TaxID=3076115 RepID=UPI002D793454|nr:haloacid dehalogenase type II [Georgenia sp. H159]